MKNKIISAKQRDNDVECPVCNEQIDVYENQQGFESHKFWQDWTCTHCDTKGRFIYKYELDETLYTEKKK